MTTQGAAPVRVKAKWRPSLSLMVFMMLTAVLALPFVGLFFFRIYENQLVHQAESELIAQSAALAATIQQDLRSHLPPGTLLGAQVPPETGRYGNEELAPLLPSLDLARDRLLPRRPDAQAATVPASEAYRAAGGRIEPLLVATQKVTLAGFRLLDPQGVVIAGRGEVGQSLAHVEEVAEALKGRFAAMLRLRISKNEPPPIYSLSRGTGVRVFTAMPVVLDGRVAAVLYASRTPSNVFRHLYEEKGKVVAAGLSVAALTLLIGLAFHRTITRPVKELIARTDAIGKGDRTALRPLDHHGTAEFAMLSQSFLDMAGALANRSDFVATFAAHVSHELKSPLTSIEGAAELLREDVDTGAMTDAERRRFLDNIAADAKRLTTITNRLRELARAEEPPTGGRASVGQAIEALRSVVSGLSIEAGGELMAPVGISSENLRIVLAHLADNALQHGAARFAIDVSREDGALRLDIRDDGPGISPNNRAQVFDSFFTTRRDSGGTGMGLAIVQTMLTAHGGSITLVESEQGARFAVMLPTA
ncbi:MULTISPECIES: HAMP domain-containing sensor histidine kinase [Bosea]|uniref:sensor histidine kinase n=1 Tax=Bosea TaxID=85413 RepID=UPI0027E2FE59|nr:MULTISPECIES: HAMP domain-containing sensor histidine kinase [Bosea]MDR6830085.1 signal transduction histidine kinase [Bosea robiniae]MDR6896954.1 signal transduction histidine kinase [Bosea sp. BE109]MDR7140365.1 signal transduction histidine kinase [Bosea sp. BE168]MDR7177048.1 signal transduction histidine kinase [Bosea sp. BE271]